MMSAKNRALSLGLQALAVALVVLGSLACLGHVSQGAAISQNNYAVGGNPGQDPYPDVTSNFFRWEQSQITYAFAANFTAAYGAAGQAKVTAAFGTWTTAVTAANGLGDVSGAFGGGDISIIGASGVFDLQSVALHEIGHAIGYDHPNGANSANNYNVDAGTGDWDNAALPGASHPVMWSTIAASTTRQVLTLDDIYAAQFLYSTNVAGAGEGDAAGPVFGNGATGLTFADITAGGNPNLADILIEAKPLAGTTLATTINSRDGGTTFGPFAAVAGHAYTKATNATLFDIIFRVPEPSSFILVFMAAGGFAVVVVRGRRGSR